MALKIMSELEMEVLLFKTRLSVVACRYLVPFYYKGETVKIPEIAEIYGFKPRSINPSFSALTKVGILSSRVGGKYEERGFMFAKDPKEVTLYDIVRALEGEAPVVGCSDRLTCQPSDCNDCSIHDELQKVKESRKKILSGTTIYEHYLNLKPGRK
ncbi:MAG: Rrf2 family transcriptional regulator [Rikenellaceae bacterium]